MISSRMITTSAVPIKQRAVEGFEGLVGVRRVADAAGQVGDQAVGHVLRQRVQTLDGVVRGARPRRSPRRRRPASRCCRLRRRMRRPCRSAPQRLVVQRLRGRFDCSRGPPRSDPPRAGRRAVPGSCSPPGSCCSSLDHLQRLGRARQVALAGVGLDLLEVAGLAAERPITSATQNQDDQILGLATGDEIEECVFERVAPA